MMDYPLCLTTILNRAEWRYPNREIVSKTKSGDIFRYTYRAFSNRVRRLSGALETLGVAKGDKVATFAFNHHRHLEAYFAIPCMGAVLHTVNIRLHPDQLVYIFNHAEDKVLLVDEDLLPLIERVAEKLTSVKAFVVMSDDGLIANTSLDNVFSYETLLSQADDSFVYPSDLDENTPLGICYTSGTTGHPKGVMYTHRSTMLHTLMEGLVDSSALSERDAVLPIVPMFHVNAWGFPYSAVFLGSKLVLPRHAMSPSQIADLMEGEGVTFAAGVPTIWLGLARELIEHPRELRVRELVSGGAPLPESLIRTYEQLGISLVHGYGMTETSPIALMNRLLPEEETLPELDRHQLLTRQGFPVHFVDVRVVGEQGEDVPWDDRSMGELLMRGPWIADSYYRQDVDIAGAFREGWLHSGDMATVNKHGSIRIVDRTKDLVKSGGEWISSVDLENAVMDHVEVFEATVVGIPEKTWGERPLALIVLKDEQATNEDKKRIRDEVLGMLAERFPKYWVPDDVVCVAEIPKTSVGKFLKLAIRDQYRDYYGGGRE